MEDRRAILWGFQDLYGRQVNTSGSGCGAGAGGVSLAARKDSSGCRQESTVFLRDCHCDPVFFFTPTMRCFAL